MATNHVSLEDAVDHILNSTSCEESESEDEMQHFVTDDPDPVCDRTSECTLDSSTSCSSSAAGSVTCSSGSSVNSLLSQLRRPTSSELSRKRVIDRNPPKGKKRSKGPNRRSDPKSVTPEQRLKNSLYGNECLTVSMGKLFCRACREELSVKSSVVNNHIKSNKHTAGKKRLGTRQKKDVEIVEALKSYDATENPVGETLPEQHRLYRIKVMRTFLLAGVPLNKLSIFRELLEENAYRLSDRRHMSDMIPFILQQEKEQIKKEISGKALSIIFDGTSRLGEVFVIVARFVQSDWCVQQRMILLQLLVKTMTGEEIARQIINTLSVEYAIQSQQVMGMIHDCASTNKVAMRTLKVLYPCMLGIGCFSHTLNRVGEKFNIPFANDFVTYWVSLFSHSSKARFLWKERTGLTICSYCPTRWWSKWEVMYQLIKVFGDVEPFLKSSDDFSANTRTRLLEYFENSTKLRSLKVELASVVDAGKAFVEATYKLESDGPIVLECYDVISALDVSIKMENYPNVQAVVKSITGGKTDVQLKWMKYARECINPAMKYFEDHLKAEIMSVPMKAFKAARLFSPHYVKKIKPECAPLNSLLNLPFITSSILNELTDEFPMYVVATNDISAEYAALTFGKIMVLPFQIGMMLQKRFYFFNLRLLLQREFFPF